MARKTDRRGLLIAAGAVAVVWGGGAAWRALDARRFEFEPIDGLPGFRRIPGGTVSGRPFDPLVGLDGVAPRQSVSLPDGDLCGALHDAQGGGVPVASFSDYFCPYCRVLTRELIALEREGRIRVTWHELPLLSPASEIAARAALAAELQGGYEALHARLMRSVVLPERAYLAEVADSAGLDAARLRADMEGAAVDRRLAVGAALAERFGFWGTPALVVGRTAVMGAIELPRLKALIALEEEGGLFCG